MLLSISLILMVGMFMGWLCQKCRLPSLLGMAVGLAVGSLLAYFFAKVHIRDTAKVLIILSISFLLVAAEDALTTAITFSALIAIMFIGIPLALGFACGDTVLTVAVLAIVLTAPLGAFAMDLSYKGLLKKG